jgi:hypothetical protein
MSSLVHQWEGGGGWAKHEAEAERDADNDGATRGMGRNVEATCGTS